MIAETSEFRRGLELTNAGVIQAVGLAMRAAIKATEASGKSTGQFKDRSGDTRASIKGVYEGNRTGFVVFGGASRLLDSGTRPHVIYGNPILRFVVNGQVMFRRMVKHPGTAARPFVREAAERGEMALDYGAEFFITQAIQRI